MDDLLILEGLVTSLDDDGLPRLSPMGPLVDRAITQITLRPYQSSQTYQNLKRNPRGVLQITDDVELISQAAIGRLQHSDLKWMAGPSDVPVLADCCRWFAFRVIDLDDSAERTTIRCEVTSRGEVRPFFGFNRAKHAVLEAAILATRIGILPQSQIQAELQRLATPVQKTAGLQERRAFELLAMYCRDTQTADKG
jgi:hypothetical protein